MTDLSFFVEYYTQLPLLIKLVWVLSVFLFLLIAGFIIYLKILRIGLRKNEINFKIYRSRYEESLINYLYAGEEEDKLSEAQLKIIKQLKKSVRNSFKRTIIISVLSKLIDEISGEMATSIKRLYFETGLIDYSLQKIKAKKWDIIASGINELTQFEVKEAYGEILKLIKHPNKEVRNEAQLYLVSLFHFKGLEFLDNLKYQLSEWDQIQLLEVLQKLENQEIGDITLWLKSTNISVTIFALKLAKFYNLFEVKNTLLELLKHSNQEVRVQVIKVLNYFQDTECKDYLKSNFYKISETEQIGFFKLLENVADKTDEDFIIKNISANNFEIKLSALKILKTINNDKFNTLNLPKSDIEGYRITNFIKTD